MSDPSSKHDRSPAARREDPILDVESQQLQMESNGRPPMTVIRNPPPSHHRRVTSELTFTGGDSPARLLLGEDYTVEDLHEGHNELRAEGDVIRALERTSPGSAADATKLMLMPELPYSAAVTFEEDQAPPEVDDDRKKAKVAPSPASEEAPELDPRNYSRSSVQRSMGLRDLTAVLMTVDENRDADFNGMDNATRGTAADRMAETAEIMFKEEGDLPQGVQIDEGGKARTNSNLGAVASEAQEKARRTALKQIKLTREQIKNNRELFIDFLKPRKKFIGHYWLMRLKFLILPATLAAAIAYYFVGNPPHGRLKQVNGTYVEEETGTVPGTPSISWWILFIAVRQVITFSSAYMWEVLLIDFLAVKTRLLSSFFGPYVSLWFAQSKGWPFRAMAWGIANIVVLQGSGRFVNHWGYWQDWVGLFNRTNPSGRVLENVLYRNLNISLVGLGGFTTVKRAVVSNLVGKRLVFNFGDKLEKVMKDVLWITQIAVLSRRIAQEKNTQQQDGDLPGGFGMNEDDSRDDSTTVTMPSGATRLGNLKRFESRRPDSMLEELGEWDEPESQSGKLERKNVTIAHLLHFRRALAFIDAEYPFSEAFGRASTRQLCVESCQRVYRRLEADGEEVMHIHVLAHLAEDEDGNIDRHKMKAIWKLLRPSRDGTLTKFEFVKSVDNVYKNLRTLIASIESSSQIEKNYETIVNWVHYAAMFLLCLSFLGVNVQSVLLSFSAFFVGVGFIIGRSCSNFLDGLLMIFVQKPYDVGDRIAIDAPNYIAQMDGHPGWIVENVNLYSTTLRFATTRELATVANSQLALHKITNLQRSKKAVIYINLKFGIDIPNTKINYLKNQVKDFVESRPREWVAMTGFRVTDIRADLGYVAYIIVLQHREAWQNVALILASKAELATFVLDISKELRMRYVAPSLPVDINLHTKSEREDGSKDEGQDAASVLKLLETKKKE